MTGDNPVPEEPRSAGPSIARAGVTALLAGLGLGLYARYVEPRRLKVTSLALRLDAWPASLDGLRIGVVGDIHVGSRHGRPWAAPALDAAVDAVNSRRLDILLLVGDYGYLKWDPEELAAAVDRFQAPSRVAVMGNHDWNRGSRRLRSLRTAMEAAGIKVLVNEAVQVHLRGQLVTIAGLGDIHARRADVRAMLADYPADPGPTILLSHSPDGVLQVPESRYLLALSGHTHGGQIAIPGFTRQIVRHFSGSRFDRGLYFLDPSGRFVRCSTQLEPAVVPSELRPLFVTRGIGMVGRRARFRSPPEVAVLALRSLPTNVTGITSSARESVARISSLD